MTKSIVESSFTVIRLIEDARFLSLISKTSVKTFCPTLGASLIRAFSGNYNKKIKFIVLFMTILKDCSVVRSYFETNVVLGNYKHVWTCLARKTCLETSANFYALKYSLT